MRTGEKGKTMTDLLIKLFIKNADQTSSGVITEFIRSIEEDTASVLDGKQIVNSMKGVFSAIQYNQINSKVIV